MSFLNVVCWYFPSYTIAIDVWTSPSPHHIMHITTNMTAVIHIIIVREPRPLASVWTRRRRRRCSSWNPSHQHHHPLTQCQPCSWWVQLPFLFQSNSYPIPIQSLSNPYPIPIQSLSNPIQSINIAIHSPIANHVLGEYYYNSYSYPIPIQSNSYPI